MLCLQANGQRDFDIRTSWQVVTQHCRAEDLKCKGACKCNPRSDTPRCLQIQTIPANYSYMYNASEKEFGRSCHISELYQINITMDFCHLLYWCTSTSTLQVCPLFCIDWGHPIRLVMHATDPGAVSRGQVSSILTIFFWHFGCPMAMAWTLCEDFIAVGSPSRSQLYRCVDY